MEGTRPTTSTDSENNFYTKKSKHKREKFELDDDAAILRRRRHIAREALRHEQRQRAPEATQLHGEQKSPERIGHVLITAEAAKHAPQAAAPEKISLEPNKRVDTLSRAELLLLSEQIAVETSSLRNIYETHLIGEHALRRLVAEYLHGEDIRKALQHEIVEHEIDFERDPALRDVTVPAELTHIKNTQVKAPGSEALDQLLQKAHADISGDDESFAYDRAHPTYRMEHHGRNYRLQRRPVDLIMALIILMLIVLVIVLLFGHR